MAFEMKYFAAFGLIAMLLFSGCITPQDGNTPPTDTPKSFQITYKVYGGFVPQELATQVLIISGNGEVKLISKNPQGTITSEKTEKISQQEVQEIIALLESKGFWEMEGNTPEMDGTYAIPPGGPVVMDAGNLDLTISLGEKTKTISVEPFVDYAMPQELNDITQKISSYFELFFEPAPETTWVSIEPTQCSTNPWEQWSDENAPPAPPCPEGEFCEPSPESGKITAYFLAVHNIEVLEVKSFWKYDVVCEACSCPRGDELQLHIKLSDLQKMLGLGWKEVKPITIESDTNIQIEYYKHPGFVINPIEETLVLSNDGKATLTVDELRDGNKTTKQLEFSRQQLEEIAARLVDLGFFDITELDRELITDVPSYTLKVTIGENSRVFYWALLRYTPDSFKYVLDEINKIDVPEGLISTDSAEYASNETIKITVKNNSGEAIFFGGCNDFSLERFDDPYVARIQQWNFVNLNECVWEGIPTKLEGGSSVERTLEIEREGIYRLRLDYAMGCDQNKPMSEADCKQFGADYSGEFTVLQTANLGCSTDDDCSTGGCSGQVCTTAELAPSVVTTCEYRNEYACLGLAGCGCINSQCQWDKDKPAYVQCIAELPSENNSGSDQPQ